ncbi:MAG: energy-coupling factor transporter ATPase [Coriobacteriia bacterium]|nr:energy-coupling factor transporter ATPase [Coriobacteriia bacterium]
MNLSAPQTRGLRFESVTFKYPGAAEPALRDVSFVVAPGECLAVLGANGSGKSTLAQLANGLVLPSEGSVTVDGVATAESPDPYEVRSRVGVVFQNPDDQIVGTVVEEDVAFGPENLGVDPVVMRERVDRALARTGLAGLERREPHLLSGGQKQRLAIAGILALEPDYLVLDEPTAMLDPRGRVDVLAILEEQRLDGRGLVHITHHVADIATADRVLVLAAGSVLFLGDPVELLERPNRLRELGLAVPPVLELAEELRRLGIVVPPKSVTAESIVSALCA